MVRSQEEEGRDIGADCQGPLCNHQEFIRQHCCFGWRG